MNRLNLDNISLSSAAFHPGHFQCRVNQHKEWLNFENLINGIPYSNPVLKPGRHIKQTFTIHPRYSEVTVAVLELRYDEVVTWQKID